MLHRLLSLALLTLTLNLASAPALAADWPHWRGPNYDGSSPEKNLPVKFGKDSNVAWAIDLPGFGPSTPVVVGDRLFTTVITDKSKALALCYDRKTGKELWRDELGDAPDGNNRSNMGGPSPSTDGKHVIFFFGTGALAGYDMEGKRLWHRNICEEYGDFSFMWTFSSSPTLHKGVVYLPVLQNKKPYRQPKFKPGTESFLLAVDPATGKNIFRAMRPAEAKDESLEAFTTIVPFTHAGREELLVAGGDCLTGHDPKTGEELWRWGTWNPTKIGHWRLVPSPVAGAGVVLGCAPKGAPVYAVKLGQKGDLSANADGLYWKSSDAIVSSDVATPLFMNGKFFVLNSDRKSLACVEPSGKVVWSVAKLPGKAKYEASPTGADGKIYVIDHAGVASVLNMENGEELHTANLAVDGTKDNRPSIVVAGGQLFIKVHTKLYCFGTAKVN